MLIGIVCAGQALAAEAPPDERVLERQGLIDRRTALGQVDQKGRATLPPQLSSEDKTAAERERRYGHAPAGTAQRFIRAEPPMRPGALPADSGSSPARFGRCRQALGVAWPSPWWSLPHPTLVWAIAAAWAAAVTAQVSGRGQALHHDALAEGGLPPWAALGCSCSPGS